jgi:hypothetical protein
MNKESFWLNKPVTISNIAPKHILEADKLLLKINKELESNRFQLDYTVIDSTDLTKDKITNIVNFINKNYITSDDDSFKLVYTDELFSFYCYNAIIIEFYPKGKNVTIGYVIGKKSNISLYHELFESSEVNFLCVIPNLRSLGISSYMINALTREIVIRYNINTAHYTISTKIKSPHFGEKKVYHRFINIPQLFKTEFVENVDQKLLIKTYNTFGCSNKFKSTHSVKYINDKLIDDKLIDDKLIDELYDNYIRYCKDTYDIYEKIEVGEFKRSFNNKMFHHFIIYKNKEIKGYVCLFRLDSFNNNTNYGQRSGFYYYMFFNDNYNDTDNYNDNLINNLEFINDYIYNNNIFDVLTFSDIFDIDYNKLKCIRGSGILRYYFYNMTCSQIQNNKNGVITI